MDWKKIGKWVLRILGGILGLIVILLIISGLIPVPRDEVVSPEDYGAGANSVESSLVGLLREFPPLNFAAGNPDTPEKAELGRLLFFDPILSQENDIACATCHHPDFGFTDGRPQASGAGGVGVGPERSGGVQLSRNAPTIWNAGYAESLFWDGRVNNLESQALGPLTHIDEMGVTDIDSLEQELQIIPEYLKLFNAAYGDNKDSVTIDNITNALAAFERTLISSNSPFDNYAAGDLNALSPSQRRGLNIFRSAATRCFECHTVPNFSTNTFRVTGVPDSEGLPHDEGRGAVVADGEDGAFRVPTLRNIALTAPYMHNGAFATLEQVIDFYTEGGGRSKDLDNIDIFVRGFELSSQQKADLIAFLFSLTDESNLPSIPDRVPSGLAVVPTLENPARELAANINVLSPGDVIGEGSPQTITVAPGETIQAAIDRARPGDTIMVPYGIYNEQVAIDLNNISLFGIPNENGEWPILDGENVLSEGVIASGNNFEVAFFQVINYTDTGILVEGVRGVHMHDLYVENTGTYGLYPVKSSDILIENSEVVGANDAGIYAGQSEDVVIRNNVVYENVLGIEVENTVGAEVYGNFAYNNTVGIFVDLLPQLTTKVSINTIVYNNQLEGNNHENFAKEGTAASLMPPGAGIGILAADNVEVYGNTIRDHETAGIGIFHMSIGFDEEEINVGPTPENIWIHDNIYENNGYAPDEFITDLGIPGADILWDVSGWNVRIDEPDAEPFPPLVPTSKWPNFFYTMYWRVLNFLISTMG